MKLKRCTIPSCAIGTGRNCNETRLSKTLQYCYRVFIIIFIVVLVMLASGTLCYSQDLKAGEINLINISGYKYQAIVYLYQQSTTYVNRPTILLNWGDGSPLDIISGVVAGCGNSNTITKKYIGSHSYLASGDYIISCEESYRIANIQNITNSQNEKLYLQNQLIINPNLGANTSVNSLNCAVETWQCCNWVYNPGCWDTDGDSLSYSLTYPITSNYSFPPVSIDSINGDITLLPTIIGNFALTLKIDEWRSIIGSQKYYIGSTYRELLVEVPSLSAINEIANNNIEISLFPNPFSVSATLQLSKPLKNASLSIYDVIGNEVNHMQNLNGSTVQITREGLRSGMYFYRLIDSNGLIGNGKMIIE